jgi:hypothetical protein
MNVILLLFLTLLPGVKPMPPESQDCSNLTITYNTQVLAGNATINVQATGGVEPYYYFFFDSKGNPLTWEFKTSSYNVKDNNFPKFIQVLDAKSCKQRIEFNESTIK